MFHLLPTVQKRKIKMAFYRIRYCDSNQTTIVEYDFEGFTGKTVRVSVGGGISCIDIVEEVSKEGPVFTGDIIECFDTCKECLKTVYRLEDCTGRYGDRYSLDVNLSEHVGSIVRIPYFQDSCFLVVSIPYEKGLRYYRTTEISGVYDDCEECRLKNYSENEFAILTCDEDRYVDIKCKFADLVWEKVISRRFDIKFCCPVDATKYTIKNNIINIDIKNDPLPELPEPVVNPCCIVQTSNCLPLPCNPCTEIEEEVDCMCEASSNSPHPCHTYSVTFEASLLTMAIGNTNTWRNGKIFFAYFPCDETEPFIVQYTEAVETPDVFCVLGIPAFGYFRENEFIYINTLVRGSICEPPIQNNCCDG